MTQRQSSKRRAWYLAAFFLLFALMAAACGDDDAASSDGTTEDTSTTAADKDPIVIGATFDLSGVSANFGRYGEQGLELAVEEINAKGGINGHPLEYKVEDHKYDTALGVSTLQKLIDVDDVVAFITYGSSITPAQAPIFKRGNVIALNAFSMTPSIEEVSRDTGLMFTTLNPSSVEVAALAKAAYDQGLRRIASLVWNNDRGLGAAKVFEEEFTKLGGEIVGEATSEPTATDYRAELTKLKGFGADGVFLSSAAKPAGGQLAQAAQLGIDTTWVCDNSCTGSEFFDLAGDAAVGVITSRQFDGVNGTPEMVALEEKVQAKYGEPAQYFHASTYDAVNVFAQAATAVLEAGDELTTENLVAALHAIEGYKGATGDITFDEFGMLEPQPVKLFTIASAEGELEPLG